MKPDDLQRLGEWLAGDQDAADACAHRAAHDPEAAAEARRQVRLHLLLRAALVPGDAQAVARRAMALASSDSSRRLRVRRIVRKARGRTVSWPSPWLIAACLACVLIGGLAAWPRAVGVGDLDPGAVVQRDGSVEASAAGLRVRPGDQVQAVQRTALTFHDGTTLTLDPGSRLKVVAAQGWLSSAAKTLILEDGALRAEVAHQPALHPLTIATPEALVTVRGTVFTLTVTPGLTVCAVQSGQVSVSHAKGRREVSGGQQVRCGREGFLEDAPADISHPPVTAPAQTPAPVLTLRGNTAPVANPEIIADGRRFLLFSQGPGIALRTSPDLLSWSDPRRVFPTDPAWWQAEHPQYRIWSPAVATWGGSHWLYYVVAGSGPGDTVLGLATATTPEIPESGGEWTDRGPILRLPRQGPDGIGDPQVALDPDGRPWLFLGSGEVAGITVRPLDPRTGRILPEPAARSLARGHQAQAPYVFRRGEWYYLFFATGNFRTTFTEAVGRSRTLLGPYVDRQGVALMEGGRTIVTRGTAEAIAPANACVVTKDGRDHLVTNAFPPPAADGTSGERHLLICPITWDREGWPVTALTPRP